MQVGSGRGLTLLTVCSCFVMWPLDGKITTTMLILRLASNRDNLLAVCRFVERA
jgi:hypothetical protein